MEDNIAKSVSVEEVMHMKGPQIFSLAKKCRVALTGCNNVDQWRDRMLLYLRVLRGAFFDIKREFGVRQSGSLDAIRQTLVQLMEAVQDAMTGLEPTLERGLLESIGSDERASLVRQIQARRISLSSSQCSVIVAGETNAGKSTFLNLLLGMDILPISIFSCTAAVCVLRYANSFSAEILYHGGKKTRQDFEGVDEAKEWLTNIVAEKSQEKRDQGLGIEAINVHLPSIILQSGVTLVDTPGIGENEAMYNCTMDFLQQNSAAAYIYVIKTDNAGGVHDDRLLEFLRAILEHNQKDKGSEVFDPSSAIFVCNRWDQVPEEQQERVKENALNKLNDVWPSFDPSQAFFVSSMNAQRHFDVDCRYVTEDYEEVLKGIKEVFGKARHNAINQHYRWLKQVLHQSSTFLQTTVHHCSQSDEELIARFRATKTKLDALQFRTTETTQQLRKRVEVEIIKLCDTLASVLHEDAVKRELQDWSLQPIPPAPGFGNGEALSELAKRFKQREQAQRWQEEVYTQIMRRIMHKVDSELKGRSLDRQLENTLKFMAQKELKLVDEEINSILHEMSDRVSLGSSVSSNSSCMSTDDDDSNAAEMLDLYKRRDSLRLSHLKRVTDASASSAKESQAVMANVPKIAIRKMLAPVTSLVSVIKNERRRSVFSNDPLQYMRDKTLKILKVVSENRQFLMQMTTKHHEKLDTFITDVENSIPRFIASNKQLMEDIRTNRRTYLSRRRDLVNVMEKLEPIREMLRGFGSLYIRDLTADNINFMLDAEQRRQSVAVSVLNKNGDFPGKDSGLGNSAATGMSLSRAGSTKTFSSSKASQGLWSTYRKGHVDIGGEKQDVIGRSYIQGLKEENLIKEIARLRCLRSPHLAPILGMSRMEDSAVFLFLGDLTSARRFLRRGFHEPRESVPPLLEGVLNGLMYLHREGLVHMELSLDTIMVTRDGEPKLCGACLPRRARFPPDADLVDADPFVCLSPEVLRGELYTADDDCYSYGLVVWETCLREKPFAEERSLLSLEEFRNQVHPSNMLGLASNDTLTENLSVILRGCLLPARGLRIKMEELREKVSTLRRTLDFSRTSAPLSETLEEESTSSSEEETS